MTCDLCHEETASTQPRGRLQLCDDCTDGWDYEAALTPAERRAEERSIAAYLDGQPQDSGAEVAPGTGAQPMPQHTKETQ